MSVHTCYNTHTYLENVCRAKETEEEKLLRLEKQRAINKRRNQEDPQQRADRLKKLRKSSQERIANETPQQRKNRQEKDRLGHQPRLLLDPVKLEALRKKEKLRKRSYTKKER